MFLGIGPDPAVHAHRVQIVTADSHISYQPMLHYDQWCLFTTYLLTFTMLILIFPTHLCYIMTYRHLHWGTWHIQDQCRILKKQPEQNVCNYTNESWNLSQDYKLKTMIPQKIDTSNWWWWWWWVGGEVCPLKINDLELNITLIFITRIIDRLRNWQEVFAYWE